VTTTFVVRTTELLYSQAELFELTRDFRQFRGRRPFNPFA